MPKVAHSVFLSLAVLAGALGCASGPKEGIRSPMGIDLRSYRRFAVMPFGDRRGLSREYSSALARGLGDMNFDVVTGKPLEAVLNDLKIVAGRPIGMRNMMELRRVARIDAVIFGNVLCSGWGGRRRASIVILDTVGGQSIFEMFFTPKRCGDKAAARAIVTRMVDAIKNKMKRRGSIESVYDITY